MLRISIKITVLLAACCLSAGCAYNVATTARPALNVYSSNQNKIPGKWAIIVRDDSLQGNAKVQGLACSANHFPLDVRDTFKSSTLLTASNVFQQVEARDATPDVSSYGSGGYAGAVIVNVDTMEARLHWNTGFWTSTPEATMTLIGGVRVLGPTGEVWSFGANAQRDTDGKAAVAGCGGGADAAAEAFDKAENDFLSQIAGRLADSPEVKSLGTATKRISPAS